MGSKTRLGSYCTKRANNGVNLVTSRKINTRLARPIDDICESCSISGLYKSCGPTTPGAGGFPGLAS